MNLCSNGCNRKCAARGLCHRCYQLHKYHNTLPPTIRKPNKKLATEPRRNGNVFLGVFPKVRMTLTMEDVLGMRGSAHEAPRGMEA